MPRSNFLKTWIRIFSVVKINIWKSSGVVGRGRVVGVFQSSAPRFGSPWRALASFWVGWSRVCGAMGAWCKLVGNGCIMAQENEELFFLRIFEIQQTAWSRERKLAEDAQNPTECAWREPCRSPTLSHSEKSNKEVFEFVARESSA